LILSFLIGVFFLFANPALQAQSMVAIGESKAYPNPFRESVTIEYQLQEEGRVDIYINNILGQQVKSLVKADLQAGQQRVEWDGMDDSGSLVRTGMYYITLLTRSEKKVIKVMKTK
jgi:flagellar hook assembly protein FlgD